MSNGAGQTRAAVILPWDRHDRHDSVRAAEARLAEAVGLAASIGLIVVHSAILPLRTRRSATLLGEGQVAAQGEAMKAEHVDVAVVTRRLAPFSSATSNGPGTARRSIGRG